MITKKIKNERKKTDETHKIFRILQVQIFEHIEHEKNYEMI